MESNALTQIGEIIDFEIHLLDDSLLTAALGTPALSASMEVKVGDEYLIFGGPQLFCSMPNSDSSDFVGLFIVKCFQAVRVHTTREMEGSLIKVKLADGKIVGISSLENDNFFYPVGEFEKLEKGEDSDD